MCILVTGAAGFIGYHTSRALLDRGDEIIAFDNLNAYYEVRLKVRDEISDSNWAGRSRSAPLPSKQRHPPTHAEASKNLHPLTVRVRSFNVDG